MTNQNEIKIGDTARVIIEVWREDELPTARNFFTGKITNIIERSTNAFYLQIENLDKLIPIDRVSLGQ